MLTFNQIVMSDEDFRGFDVSAQRLNEAIDMSNK